LVDPATPGIASHLSVSSIKTSLRFTLLFSGFVNRVQFQLRLLISSVNMAVTIPDIFPVAFQNHRATTLTSALHQPGDPSSDTFALF
jgi:hypothetical protein